LVEIHRMEELTDNRILITGASRGIGRATALLAGKMGAKVGINYVNHQTQAKLVKQEVERLGGEAILLEGDVRKHDEVKQMIRQMQEKWEGVL